jgi:hypothetical protein
VSEEQSGNTIIRRAHNRENPYALIAKAAVNDSRLSFKALGILVYILSKPDDWKTYARELAKSHDDGRDAVLSGLKELEQCGYLVRTRPRDEETGLFRKMEVLVYEEPVEAPSTNGFSGSVLSGSGLSGSGKADTTNTEVPSSDSSEYRPSPSAQARGAERERLRSKVKANEQWAVSALFNEDQPDTAVWLVDNNLWPLALQFQRRFKPHFPTFAAQLYAARGKGSDFLRAALEQSLMAGKTAGYLKFQLEAAPDVAAPVEQDPEKVKADVDKMLGGTRQLLEDLEKEMDL